MQVSPLFIFAHLVSLSLPRNFNAAWVIFLYQPCAPNAAKSKRTFMPWACKIGRKKLCCFFYYCGCSKLNRKPAIPPMSRRRLVSRQAALQPKAVNTRKNHRDKYHLSPHYYSSSANFYYTETDGFGMI